MKTLPDIFQLVRNQERARIKRRRVTPHVVLHTTFSFVFLHIPTNFTLFPF